MSIFNTDAESVAQVGENNTYIEEFYQESSASDKYTFIEENLDDVRSDEFIAPAHSRDIVHWVLSKRFLLLSGKDRMGKAALSRHIADMLLQANPDGLSVKKIRQNVDLIEVLDDLISEKTLDHIVLGYDINIQEIQEHLDVLIRISRQKSKFIVFTTESLSSIPSALQDFLIEVQVNYPYTHQNIEKLLTQYFQPENIELKENIHNISKRVISPSVAIRLAESLLKESPLPEYNEWINRLNDLKDFSKETDNWLSKLGKNECILFLTLALFHDLPDRNFWRIYETFIDALKERDPTLIKLDYYALEENREFIASEHRIAFKHIRDRDGILLRLLKLHRRSLLKVLPSLGKQIDKLKDDWQMRIATAEAIGYIATVEEEDVNDILYAWAKHKSPSVRAAVGHAHRQMIKAHRQLSEDNAEKAILRILDQMSLFLCENSKERETMEPRWTVAASLERINNYVPEDIFEQKILPIFKKLYHDDHIAVRKAVIHSIRKIGLTRFQQIRPILAIKAKDHRVEVQLEVAETLASLSLSINSDIHQLLQEWLVGQDEDRLWTAFYTFYLLDSQKEDQLSILQQQILENSNLQSRVINKLNEILTSKNISDKKIIDLFDSIARRNDLSMNTILLVQILAENIYKHQKSACDIVEKWRSSDIESLNELADVIEQRHDQYKKNMQIERDYLLSNELNNDELLNNYALKLPEEEQSVFWNEVDAKRKYAMQVERDYLLNKELNNDKLLNEFSLRLPENERSAFWDEVKAKREEREIQKQQRIKTFAGVVIFCFVMKFILGVGIPAFILMTACCYALIVYHVEIIEKISEKISFQ